MARNIIMIKHHPFTISDMGYGLGTFLLCAFALFMCVDHSRRRWRRWKPCYSCINPTQDPVIQLNPEEIIDYQFGDVDRSGEGSLWKKNILMGGKCQLPDFSGVIMYDTAGNLVTAAKNQLPLPALAWQ